MSTKRHDEEENRESFQKEKNKVKFEEAIDRNRIKVDEKKNEKHLKRKLKKENTRFFGDKKTNNILSLLSSGVHPIF